MELISKEDLINKINAYMITTPDVTMVRKLISELPTIELIYCQECEYLTPKEYEYLTPRESFYEPIKSRLPKELIGYCGKTDLYVHENDYCRGADMRGSEE